MEWREVEKAIYKEIMWLKDSIEFSDTKKYGEGFQDDFIFDQGARCLLRDIAIDIISGKIQAKEMTTNKVDLWDGLTKSFTAVTRHTHGGEWHAAMMDVIEQYFVRDGYEVTTEPYLNQGRSDLGIYKNNEKPIYVEVGTISLYKLWVNLKTMCGCVFLLVLDENKVIEFELSDNLKY